MPESSATYRICRALIRLGTALVPLRMRDEWTESWEAEVWHHGRRLARDGHPTFFARVDLVLRTTGALTHAAWLAVRERRSPDMGNDVRYAIRNLVRKPGFTLVTVLSLTLGIGANSLMFSVVDGVLLNPFPYPEPDRLISIGNAFPKINRALGFVERNSAPEFLDMRSQSETLEHFTAFDLGNRDLGGIDEPQRLFTAFVLGDPFVTLGIKPYLGRGFLTEEIERGDPVAIVSYRVWQQRFAGDSSVVGGQVTVNGVPRTLIGVMAPRMLLIETDMWLPWGVNLSELPRDFRPLNVLARIRPGFSMRDAETELSTIAGRIEREYVGAFPEYEGWTLAANTLTGVYANFAGPAGWIVLGAVGFVLLIACANIANLLLARGAARRQEIAVRMALGAERARIMQQLLIESVMLALVGGVLGLIVASAGTGVVLGAIPQNVVPGSADVGLNVRVLSFTFLIAVTAGVVFGLVPAVQNSKTDVKTALSSEGGRTATGGRGLWWRRTFVVAEIGLAVVLLAGAGLMIRSFANLRTIDAGVDVGNVLTMRLTLARERFNGDGVMVFFNELVDGVARIPGVRQAAVTSQFPPSEPFAYPVRLDGAAADPSDMSLPNARGTIVHPDLIQTLGMSVVRGRAITPADVANAPPVALINETFGRRYFPDEDPLGRRFTAGRGVENWRTIVGIVSDAANNGLDQPVEPEYFTPLDQSGGSWNQLFLIVRTDGDPLGVLPGVRQMVQGIDADQPVYAIQTLSQRFANAIAPQRIAMVVLFAMAAIALGLAAMGIYGVMSYSVTQRTREIGLRVALGATSGSVIVLVASKVAKLIGIGLGLGLAATVAMTGVMRSLLFDVSGTDPLTLAGVAVVLAAIALVAGLIPARRAALMDPMSALHWE